MKLSTKAASFFIVLLGIAVANLLYQSASVESENNATNMQHARTLLTKDIQALQHLASNYGANAPRNYEAYFRDVALYHKQFEAAVAELETHNQNIGKGLKAVSENYDASLLTENLKPLIRSQKALSEDVKLFAADYKKRVGDDNEPRLEWAAKSINDHAPIIEESGRAMNAYLEQRLDLGRTLGYSLALSLIFISLLFFVWFALNVIQRIRLLAEMSDKVADGDFGLQLTVSGKDEISAVARSFNSVSIRMDLVLKLLAELDGSQGQQASVDAVMSICSEYFSVDWAGMVLLEDENTIQVTAASPVASLKRWFSKTGVAEGNNLAAVIRDHINQQTPWLVRDVDSYAISVPDSRLMRELIRNTHAKMVLGIPLEGGQGQKPGMLLLASQSSQLVEGKRGELLLKLAPIISRRIQQRGFTQNALLNNSNSTNKVIDSDLNKTASFVR